MVIVRVTATMHWWSARPCRLSSVCLCVCRYWAEVQGEHAGKVLIGAHFCCCVLASEEPVCHLDTKVIVCVCVRMNASVVYCIYVCDWHTCTLHTHTHATCIFKWFIMKARQVAGMTILCLHSDWWCLLVHACQWAYFCSSAGPKAQETVWLRC